MTRGDLPGGAAPRMWVLRPAAMALAMLLAAAALGGCARRVRAPRPPGPPRPPQERVAPTEGANLALGRLVLLAPEPDLLGAARTADLATLLTDGRLSGQTDQRIWFRPDAVAYNYGGLAQWAVDLGEASNIGEVAARFQGGSPFPGVCFPCWIDLVASDDGVRYYRVASYSRFREGDAERFGVPRDEGRPWVHTLRFRGVNVRARFVGLSFYTTGYTAGDEMYVLAGPRDATYRSPADGEPSGFSTTAPALYFHKPVLQVPIDMSAPLPIGAMVPTGAPARVTVTLDLPSGIEATGGDIGGVRLAGARGRVIERGAYTRYALPCTVKATARLWSRLYWRSTWPEGRVGMIRWQVTGKGWESPLLRQPVVAVRIPPAAPPRRLMTGLAWWEMRDTLAWPNALAAFQRLGFNTVPVFGHRGDVASGPVKAAIDRFREAGFRILNVDSTFHVMLAEAGSRKAEVTCQFAGGGHGDRVCPSYRGPLYEAELARLAGECRAVDADALSCDIELWHSSGPVDSRRCTRCQADFRRSGLGDWKAWQRAKGEEIWRDVVTRVRQARAGQPGRLEVGVFAWHAGGFHDDVWPFDRLYPEYLSTSEPALYTPLYPYHLALVGDTVRADRARLPRGDVVPWLTPGDAGPFSGEALTAALLECYANGARGVRFWSERLWDTESLAAYARATRIVGPVEDIVLDGRPVEGVRTAPPVRVSGMARGDEMFLLVADYAGRAAGPVEVRLPLRQACAVVDLETGETVARIEPGAALPLTLNGRQPRALHVRPLTR